MTEPEQPEGVPPMFPRTDGLTPEFAADIETRIKAFMALHGLSSSTLSPLDAEAVALHEVFSALVRAGFTRDEAISYLAQRRQ